MTKENRARPTAETAVTRTKILASAIIQRPLQSRSGTVLRKQTEQRQEEDTAPLVEYLSHACAKCCDRHEASRNGGAAQGLGGENERIASAISRLIDASAWLWEATSASYSCPAICCCTVERPVFETTPS